MSTLVTSNIKHSGSASNNVELDSSGNLKFNSGYGSAEVAYGCRAWVNFDGTLSGTIAPRASGNVSSVTKNGTGDYTVNFTTAMVDANYTLHMTQTSTPAGGLAFTYIGTLLTSSVRVFSFGNYPSGTAAASDSSLVCVAIFR